MTEIKKRQPRRTATVNYYDPITGEFITSELITAAPFVKWGKIAEIQKLILELYVETGGSISDLFCHETFIPLCQQLSTLIPVVGQTRPIDFQALLDADDWPQITRLFITTSYDDAGNRDVDAKGEATLIEPGIIADLHNLNFLQILVDKERERQKRLEKQLAESEAVEATK
jgi:hypothetical protein